MENPTAVVKTALQPANVIRFLIGSVVAFALLDLLGFTDYLLYPVTNLKAKFSKSTP